MYSRTSTTGQTVDGRTDGRTGGRETRDRVWTASGGGFERVAATCPLGDHRSTEHRVLFRPTSIGLRSGTRSLALFVKPVPLPLPLSLPPLCSLNLHFFSLSFVVWKGRRMYHGQSVNIHVCLHVAVCTAMYTFLSRAVSGKLGTKKKKTKNTTPRYAISRVFRVNLSRVFSTERRCTVQRGQIVENLDGRDALRILKIRELANGNGKRDFEHKT